MTLCEGGIWDSYSAVYSGLQVSQLGFTGWEGEQNSLTHQEGV